MNETGLVLYVYHQGEDGNGEETCLTVRWMRGAQYEGYCFTDLTAVFHKLF